MPTTLETKMISTSFQKQSDFRCHNAKLFEIFEGELAKFVLESLRAQLSEQAFDSISSRLAPINVLKRIVDKQSKIYTRPPSRLVFEETGTKKDVALLAQYERCFDINFTMQLANELFNLHKSVALEPYLKDNKPKLRTLPADRFVVSSLDPIEPNKMTHFAKIMGCVEGDENRIKLHCYSATEFWVQDQNGKIISDDPYYLASSGINPFGVVPFIYINRSKHELVPVPDSDTLQMTKLIPILISDLNYAAMYQCFSIIYGIDVDDEDLKMAPNAFWRLKSDPATDKKPEVGTIKPQVDISEVAEFISSQLAMWLQSKGIRPGAVGKLSAESFSSGISKTIDEMDTSEDREAQTHYFQTAEEELWHMVAHQLHPVWSKTQNFFIPGQFSPNVEIQVVFPEQRSDQSVSNMVDDEIKKLNAYLTTRKLALTHLHQDMNEEEIEALMLEIERDRTTTVVEQDPDVGGGSTEKGQEDEDTEEEEAYGNQASG